MLFENIDKALERAKCGGWDQNECFVYMKDNKVPDQLHLGDILQDIRFWSALGKAESWEEVLFVEWKNQMHKFTEHLINSGSIDGFFRKTLK